MKHLSKHFFTLPILQGIEVEVLLWGQGPIVEVGVGVGVDIVEGDLEDVMITEGEDPGIIEDTEEVRKEEEEKEEEGEGEGSALVLPRLLPQFQGVRVRVRVRKGLLHLVMMMMILEMEVMWG